MSAIRWLLRKLGRTKPSSAHACDGWHGVAPGLGPMRVTVMAGDTFQQSDEFGPTLMIRVADIYRSATDGKLYAVLMTTQRCPDLRRRAYESYFGTEAFR